MEEITKKGAWSPEEDHKLKAYIMRYGIWNWNLMSKFAGLSRTGKSCRLRWMNYLHPDVKRGPFTVEEVETVIKMYQDLGNRWAAIATRLPGRTDNEVKNFFHTHLKRHLGVKNIDAPMKSKTRSTKRVVKKSKEIKRANGSSKAQEKPVLFPTMIGTSRNKSSLMLSHDISSNPVTHHQSADSLRIESLDKFDTSSFWLHLLNDAHRLIL